MLRFWYKRWKVSRVWTPNPIVRTTSVSRYTYLPLHNTLLKASLFHSIQTPWLERPLATNRILRSDWKPTNGFHPLIRYNPQVAFRLSPIKTSHASQTITCFLTINDGWKETTPILWIIKIKCLYTLYKSIQVRLKYRHSNTICTSRSPSTSLNLPLSLVDKRRQGGFK